MAEAAARTGMIDWKKAFARTDLALALGVVCMLVILIMPMPTWLMDFNLALSITFSALVLMTAIFIEKTLEFTSFPFILLITTMFRLSLNLASTRLILANGHRGTNAAGHVIEAFGGFVMGGNFVIGVIVFAILIVVNFMVITKGSTRIAEVAARFTLDAMPGKQMAIDADLSSGLIDEDEARRRRDDLGRESSFFGAMDGASKFVRGDAIAGLIITLINIIAGLVIGMAQKGLSFSQASDFYIRLTVGDGLVSQIPALVISMAAGRVVSKAGMMNKSTDKVLFGQLAFYPKALGMSSFLGAALAVLPGTPAMPFLSLAALSGFGAWYIDRSQRQAKRAADDKKEAASKSVVPAAEEPASAALKMDQISLMLGYGLLPLVTDGTRSIPDQIKVLRRGLAKDLGFIMPSIRIADNMALPANEYVIYIKEVEAGRGELRPNMLLAMNSSGSFDLPGEKTFEPAFGQPALWVDPMYKEDAMFRGYTVVDASMVMTTHLIEVIKANMSDLLSYSETQKLLDEIGKENQKLVSEIVPGRMGVGGIPLSAVAPTDTTTRVSKSMLEIGKADGL